jgi:bifunctional UDP-N-acetylglucosamine pyrophosphorylase/glucosamine-1-phosphate N-acetyltransferase
VTSVDREGKMGEKDALLGLVLAAGRGTRMRSGTPKLLHPVCGRPILYHSIRAVQEVGAVRTAVIVGPDEAEIRVATAEADVELVRQDEPLGTGDAVLRARPLLESHEGPVLVVNGDHPLYRPATLARLVERFLEGPSDLVILTGELPDPTGYGRIVRGPDGSIDRIVEESDADEAVRALREINLGLYVARGPFLLDALEQVGNRNRQGEYFLTDVVEVALRGGHRVETVPVEDWTEALGVNTRSDLSRAESILRRRIADHWMARGVTFTDPAHTYLDVDVEIGADTHLDPGCALRRGTRVGARCRIAMGAVIDGSTLGEDVFVKPHCWIEDAVVGSDCEIGPSAHLRPGTVLEDGVRIGNFVEVKNSRLGRGTKADHLSYIGDADVGSGVTIGCGAITVNYDGEAKHRTRIGDGAFVGCNSNLIAPIEVAAGAYVAAGSTITKGVPEDALGVARARQRNVKGWRARRLGGEPGPGKKGD